MKCERCGKELGDSVRCSFCGFENGVASGNVREMSRAERNFFDGVTIETGEEDKSQKNHSSGKHNFSVRGTYINFSGGGGFFSRLVEKFVRALLNDNLAAKVVAGLIIVALVGILFFLALPIMFFLLALGVAIFLLRWTK